MKKTSILLLFLLIVNTRTMLAQGGQPTVTQGFTLDGIQTMTIEGENWSINGSISLSENATLTIIDSNITVLGEESQWTLSMNSHLTVVNTSIRVISGKGIQATDNASIGLDNADLYSAQQSDSRTYYDMGIGLAENSKITAVDSKIGYLRTMGNAECNIEKSHIGDYGTMSGTPALIRDSAIERVFLVYENSRVQINESLAGTHLWFSPSQLVKAGETLYDVLLINTTILGTPAISIRDGKLEAHDIVLDAVYVGGDSAIEVEDSEIYYLQLNDYAWALLETSNIKYIVASEGDFNIQLKNTTHTSISTYRTMGLNLKTSYVETEYLNLNYAYLNTPQNVELRNTMIENLQLDMYSPQPIQCDNVSIGTLTLEPGWGNENPITITGSIDFAENASLHQQTRDGHVKIKRVYLVKAKIDGAPAADTELTIQTDNNTRTMRTNEKGEAVITVTYLRNLHIISDPEPGGPYIINIDNLTKPALITFNNEKYNITLLCDTPIELASTTYTPPTATGEGYRSIIGIGAVSLAALAIGIGTRLMTRRDRIINA